MTPSIPPDLVTQAMTAVDALDLDQRNALVARVHARRPALLAYIPVLERCGATPQQINVVLSIVLVLDQAMELSGQTWALIDDALMKRCMPRLHTREALIKGLGNPLLSRKVERQILAYPEPALLAFAFARLRDNNLHAARDSLEQSVLITTMHMLECIIVARIATPTKVARRAAA